MQVVQVYFVYRTEEIQAESEEWTTQTEINCDTFWLQSFGACDGSLAKTKIYIFLLCFILNLGAISKFKTPRGGGGLYPDGRFYGGFFPLRIWGLIFGGAYFRNFTVFSRTFYMQITYNESENFSGSSLHHVFESENFRCPILWEK